MQSVKEASVGTDVYAVVSNHFISQLENGTIPWHTSFKDAGIPRNVTSQVPYSGINIWLLASLKYKRNLFLTYKQVCKLGGSVKRGEQGHIAVFKTKEDKGSMLKTYKLYNIEQCTGISLQGIPKVKKIKDPIDCCMKIAAQMPNPPSVKHTAIDTSYSLAEDSIHMPPHESFTDQATYFSVLFQALVYSTAHPTRLNRKEIFWKQRSGDRQSVMDDLIAEMGASYLCSFAGIDPMHLNHEPTHRLEWIDAIAANPKLIVEAGIQAQRAVNYILDGNTANAMQVQRKTIVH